MKKLTIETLVAIQESFPAVDWDLADLEELIVPRSPLISGFPQLMADIEKLTLVDLAELPPAGGLFVPEEPSNG